MTINRRDTALVHDIYALPRAGQFSILYQYRNGGMVLLHKLTKTDKPDYYDVLDVAIKKATQGSVIEILPIETNTSFRPMLFPHYNRINKSPDLRDAITGEYYEVESTDNYRNITKRISSGYKQADIVILVYKGELINQESRIKKIFKEHIGLKRVIIYANNKILDYPRP